MDVANSSGVTALMVACRYGREACARALLDKGANVDVANSDGFTALMAACQNGHEACARALLDKGAKVDVADSDGWAALSEEMRRPIVELGKPKAPARR